MPKDQDKHSIASLSEVTPPKKPKAKKAYHYYLYASLSLGFLLFCFLRPHSSTTREQAQESVSSQNAFTLSENLTLIEALKQKAQEEQAAKPLVSQSVDRTKPPKLRSKPKLSKELLLRMNAPTTFFNGGTAAQPLASKPGQAAKGTTSLVTNNPNAEFMSQQNDIVSVRASRLNHPNYTLPAGEMISATLETAINPELPGLVRATTTMNSYSLVGQHLLIPKGSELLGQYNSSRAEGQTRIFVVWNRVLLANGVRVSLNSPSTDAIGRAGQDADYINRHFFERFSMSALQTVLGATLANTGVNGQDEYNSRAQYRMGLASSFQQASNQSLQANNSIPTTLQANQGAEVNVFVAQDLDFYDVHSMLRGNRNGN